MISVTLARDVEDEANWNAALLLGAACHLWEGGLPVHALYVLDELVQPLEKVVSDSVRDEIAQAKADLGLLDRD
ncbi:MAG: hypothetical protein ABFS34_09365 [Gemmatimonadota bacterium]